MAEAIVKFLSSQSVVVIFLLAGLFLFVISLLGQLHASFIQIVLSGWQRIVCAAVGAVFIAVSITASLPRDPGGVPLGAVIPFWGALTDIPPGFELCDGAPVTTLGSPLYSKPKPDLRDTFIKGAAADTASVRENPEKGGENFKDLNHTHGAGDLRALIGTPGNSYFLIFQTRGGRFDGNRQVGGGTTSTPGDVPHYGVAVDGSTATSTGDTLKRVDMRPKFHALYYIIRVK